MNSKEENRESTSMEFLENIYSKKWNSKWREFKFLRSEKFKLIIN